MAQRLRAVGQLVLVTAIVAVALRVLDSVPRFVTGLPRGVTQVRSLEALRQHVGFALPMPAYFPSTLEWPPRDIRVYRGQDIAVIVRQRATNEPALIVASAPSGAGGVQAPALPPATVLQTTDVPAGAGTAIRLQRVEDRARVVWHQATWHQAGRLTIVRYRGTVDELMRIAESLKARSAR
jgi:hypothetical protein